MNREQITPAHHRRLACVYIRQSSDQQVLEHRESQRRQRGLIDRAVELGWPAELVTCIDVDLGQSAARSNERQGFEQMIAETALGKVGMILALEVSRLSRGNRDWYHLLDICAVTHTLIADADGLYDPRHYNDRLLLGLKGTMSEAELHVMKQRLVEAMKSKALRGEFQLVLAPGFVWDEAGRIQKVADEQVQGAIARVFERFEQIGTIHQAHSALRDEGFKLPSHDRRGGTVRWKSPTYGSLHRMLTHPLYAGAYAYGRRQVEETLDASMRPVKRIRKRTREDWHALLLDHHEGYISWAHFERNQRQVEANRRGPVGPGAPRVGESLLQGLVLCGRCGRRMQVRYGARVCGVRFSCTAGRRQTGGPPCQEISGLRVERAIEALVLEALQPLGVEAMIEAAAAQAQACSTERLGWQQRVERARYEADLARRQHDEVDPANRLVARELERRWEGALQALNGIEREASERLRSMETTLRPGDEARLRRHAQDLSTLWRAPTTRPQDRKRIVRLLIERVVVAPREDPPTIEAQVHWSGGEVSSLSVARNRVGRTRYRAPEDFIDLIRTLALEFSDSQVACVLNRRAIRTPKGLTFTANRVAVTRNNHDIPPGPVVPTRGDDIRTAMEAAELLGVERGTVIRWVEAGLLKGAQVTECAPWRIRVTAEDIERLKPADATGGFVTLKKAALVLGISQQAVVQRVNRGVLGGMRVRNGRRSSWRIRLPTTTCDGQATLFNHADPSHI